MWSAHHLDDESIKRSKAVLDYTSRDFTSIRAQLIGLAQGHHAGVADSGRGS